MEFGAFPTEMSQRHQENIRITPEVWVRRQAYRVAARRI